MADFLAVECAVLFAESAVRRCARIVITLSPMNPSRRRPFASRTSSMRNLRVRLEPLRRWLPTVSWPGQGRMNTDCGTAMRCGQRSTSTTRALIFAALGLATNGCGGDTAGPLVPEEPIVNENLSVQMDVLSRQWVQPVDAEITAGATVKDAAGRPKAGVVVTFTAETPGASVRNAVLTTDADGIVRGAVLKVGPSLGEYTFTASAPRPGATYSFKTTVVSGRPIAIDRVGSDGQTVTAGGYLRIPPKVRVTDSAGRNVPNVRVTWAPVTPDDTSCANSVTDWDGTDVCGWRLTAAGSFDLTASIAGASARFSATALAVPASFTFANAPDSAIEVRTATDLPPVVVEVRMADGSPGRGYPVTFGRSGTILTTTAVTDSSGRASSPWRTGESPARLEFSASLDGVKRIATSVRTFGTPSFILIAAGRSHTCGYAGWMGLLCWGSNSVQQAGGAAGAPDQLVPFALIRNPFNLYGLWALGDHSCIREHRNIGRTETNIVMSCWGLGPDGVLTFGAPANVPLTAYQLAGFEGASLDAPPSARVDGALHACVHTQTPSVYCVGRNDHGQLGDGTSINRSSPVAVVNGTPLGLGLPILGESHSCGIGNGGAWHCWGRNDSGQLGDGTFTDRWAPTPLGGGQSYASLAAGVAHTCGLTSAGAAYCWGANTYGQLGTGSVGGRAATPQLVAGGHVFNGLAVGDHHSCGKRTDGPAYCWGRNTRGQLGDGTTIDRGVPTRVQDLHAPR